MMVDSNGQEVFPTPQQQQQLSQVPDLNAPPPNDGTGSNQQPGAQQPGQFSNERQQQQQQGSGDGNTPAPGQWRYQYGKDAGQNFRPGSAPPGTPGGDLPPAQQYNQNSQRPAQPADGGTQAGDNGSTNYGTGGLTDSGDPVETVNPWSAAFVSGTSAYLLKGPIPSALTKAADYSLEQNWRINRLIPEGGWLDKATGAKFANQTRSAFQPSGAQWLKDHLKPAAKPATGGPGSTATDAPASAPKPAESTDAAAAKPAETADGGAPPIEPAAEPRPPIEPAAEPRPPIEPAAEPRPPIEPAAEPRPPIEPAAEPHPPIEPAAEPHPPIEPAAEPRPPIEAADEPKIAPEPVAAETLGEAAGTATANAAKKGFLSDLGEAGSFLSKPGIRTFAEGAAVGASMLAVDKLTPGNDKYGLGTIGMTAAFAGLPEVAGLPGDTKTKLMIAGGALVLGKTIDWLLPADKHPDAHNFIAPGLMDTGLMTGALFLPTADPRMKLAAVGGAYLMGRMGKVGALPAAAAGAGLGYAAYRFTHNAEIGVAVGVGSWVGSRVEHLFEK
jgi:hypothetical protein